MNVEASVLDRTVDMLQVLDDNELRAIQAVAGTFIANSSTSRPYKPQTERELLNRVDYSLECIKKGAYQDSESFEQELMREFDL